MSGLLTKLFYIALPLLLVPVAWGERGLGIKLENFEQGPELVDLTAAIDLELSTSLRDALSGGTELRFIIEMQMMQQRWLVDEELVRYAWTGAVRRREYGQGYEFQAFGDDTWQEASVAADALRSLSVLRIQFTDPRLIADLANPRIYFNLRVEVDLDSLPNALKVDLLTSADWNFSSGWQPHP